MLASTVRWIAISAAVLTSLFYAHASVAGGYGSWRVLAGGRALPLFYNASGVAVGPAGTIYVADRGDHRVELISPLGRQLTIWGTDGPSPLRFEGPRSIAVDGSGNVYLADYGVIKLSSTGRFLARWTGGTLRFPRGLAVDAHGDVYVLALHPVPYSNLFDRMTVSKLSPSGKRLSTYEVRYPQPTSDALESVAMTAAPSGDLLLSIRGQRHCHDCDGTYYLLRRLDGAGKIISDTSETSGGESVAADRAGYIYLTEPHRIQKLSPQGASLLSFGETGCSAGALGSNLLVATSAAGTLYVADSGPAGAMSDNRPTVFGTGVLHAFTSSGAPLALYGQCPVVSTHTVFGQINDLAAAHGGVYVADGVNSVIQRVTAAGALSIAASISHPSTVASDAAGNIYAIDVSRSALEKLSPTGSLLARTSNTLVDAVAVGPRGTVYGLTPFGQVQILPPVGHGSHPVRQWYMRGYTRNSGGLTPEGICLDGQGNIWLADIRHNNIQEYSPGGRLLRIWGRGGAGAYRYHNPTRLTVDGRGHLFITDSGNNRVVEYDLRGRYLRAFGREGQAPGQFMYPVGIAADGKGNIYVGDRWNDRVQILPTG